MDNTPYIPSTLLEEAIFLIDIGTEVNTLIP